MITLLVLLCAAIVFAFPVLDVGIAICAMAIIVKFLRWLFGRKKK